MAEIITLIGIGLVALLSILELGLRLLFGFGAPLLYVADPDIGYLLKPNQQTRRFGHDIAINQYSMRSPSVTLARPANTVRILLLGDSIANGGWWTDQAHTISTQLQQQLQARQSSPSQAISPSVEVLNASANSWGPRNELAYLKRYGCFEAQVIVLLINTDDLFATPPTSLPVGRDRNYPDHKPPLAIAEVMTRYLLKPSPIPELDAVQKEGGDRVGRNLEAIQAIQSLAAQSNSQFLLAMTPLWREIGTPGSRDYEIAARQRLQTFTQQAQIPYIDFLPSINALPQPRTIYHDHIHFNRQGNQHITEMLLPAIEDLL